MATKDKIGISDISDRHMTKTKERRINAQCHLTKKIVGENAKQTYESLDSYAQYMKLCNLAAVSNLSANNLAAALHVNPQASEAGTLAYWNRRGRSIKQGEKGIPILKPYGDHMECGYAFDRSQTQPSARAISAGRTQYEPRHPYDDMRAAAIYVNSGIPPHEQVRETLNQYFRYQFAKTLNKSQRRNWKPN